MTLNNGCALLGNEADKVAGSRDVSVFKVAVLAACTSR